MANVDELLRLAQQYHKAGQREHAEQVYRQVLGVEPQHPEALQRLGVIAIESSRGDESIALFRQAIAAKPSDPSVRCNLGAAYCTLGHLEQGREVLEETVRQAPEYFPALYNLGLVQHRLGQFDRAAASYRACTALKSDYYPASRNLGVVLQELGELDEARQCFERVCEMEPRDASSHVNLATVLKDQGDCDGAMARYDEALRLAPESADARYRRGQLHLSVGRFPAGWADFEYRTHCREFDTLRLRQPRWDGSPLPRGSLLVHCEQGLGDTLQFIRYVTLVRQRCGRVVVAAQPPLIPLLDESGFGPLVSRDEPPDEYDSQVPLLSLPSVFGTDLSTVPREVPYLAVDPPRVAKWREELSGYGGTKIGIAWQGQPQYHGDRMRSIPLTHFAPLANVPGVRLFSLQKGPGSEQLVSAREHFEVVDLAPRLDAAGAFLDTAAVMQSLDLVVTSDTAAAHLAGGLGVKVWLALAIVPDWRWMVEGGDSPWYPTMRLFRQRQRGDWQQVFHDMAGALEALDERP